MTLKFPRTDSDKVSNAPRKGNVVRLDGPSASGSDAPGGDGWLASDDASGSTAVVST